MAKPRVYSSSLEEFRETIVNNQLFERLDENFPQIMGRSASPGERKSWRMSLPRFEHALQLAKIPGDVWISIEERVPYCSERIDVLLFGYDRSGSKHVVIIELKGWKEIALSDDGNIEVYIGGKNRTLPHPSEQAQGYHQHLEDFCRAFQGKGRILLSSCAYCYEYREVVGEGLFHQQFDDLQQHSPIFGYDHTKKFAALLDQCLGGGKGKEVLDQFDVLGLGPSKELIKNASEVIRNQKVFRLLDEQIAANNAIVQAIKTATKKKTKQVILVRGGPGTGKSVIALNAAGAVLKNGLTMNLVSGSSAFTHGLRKILKRLEKLIVFTDRFWDAEPDSIPVLIVDEAHRIRERTIPRVATHLRPQIPQIDELLAVARVAVFFMDENQIISPDEVGEPELVRDAAKRFGASIKEFELLTQFRCNGSDAYMKWLDDLLQIGGQDDGTLLMVPTGFNFRVIDSPFDLLAEVKAKNSQFPNSARLLAGWCWPWSDPLPDGLVDDIVIGSFRFPWESKINKKPPPGIPEAKHWAIDPAGVNQAGTVYSVQGYETQHVGVIIGRDMVYRRGKWIAQPRENFKNILRARPPEIALPYLKRIYRTLFSRAMQSCSVFCLDEETREFIESRIVKAPEGV